MWGQALFCISIKASARIIPTRVGTSSIFVGRMLNVGDHPHACGDKSRLMSSSVGMRGSSPRVWGQAYWVANRSCGTWIIPTRVGTSLIENISDTIDEDHPHACGDKYLYKLCVVWYTGSSPRVWGQGNDFFDETRHAGIIPTRVGTSYQ